MPFASINSINPRTNPWNFHEKYWELAHCIRISYLAKSIRGLFKVNLEFSFSFPGFSIFSSSPGFQICVSNLRFTSYFNFSFNLFLSNCWLLAFGFLQGSAVKPRFWTFFSVNYCFFAQQPRIRVGFKTQVFNSQFLTQTDISFSRSHLKFWIPGLL